jgi:hypothetical protein
MRACEDRARRNADRSGGEPAFAFGERRPVPLLAECDVCGSPDLAEIRCKVICRNCRTILQSCADL